MQRNSLLLVLRRVAQGGSFRLDHPWQFLLRFVFKEWTTFPKWVTLDKLHIVISNDWRVKLLPSRRLISERLTNSLDSLDSLLGDRNTASSTHFSLTSFRFPQLFFRVQEKSWQIFSNMQYSGCLKLGKTMKWTRIEPLATRTPVGCSNPWAAGRLVTS